MSKPKRERAVFVELYGGVPHSVIVEKEAANGRYLCHHDVDNVGTVESPDLWHRDVGSGFLELCRQASLFDLVRGSAQPTEVWWSEDVPISAPRPLAFWIARRVRRLLGVTWSWWEPSRSSRLSWLFYSSRPSRLHLWRLGYRRLERPPLDPDDPFADMVEGDTVYCQVCDRTFPDEPYSDFVRPEGYEVTAAAARWLAAYLLGQTLERWQHELGDDAPATADRVMYEVVRAFRERLEAEARHAADSDPQKRPWWELHHFAKKCFPDAVRAAARCLADELEDEARCERVEHLCPHVWWEEGVGWTGPGACT